MCSNKLRFLMCILTGILLPVALSHGMDNQKGDAEAEEGEQKVSAERLGEIDAFGRVIGQLPYVASQPDETVVATVSDARATSSLQRWVAVAAFVGLIAGLTQKQQANNKQR